MASLQIANDGSRLRLNTTIKLRWFAVAGQTATVLSVHYGYRFPLPFDLCLGVIGLSIALNIVLTLAYPRPQHLPARHAALLLGFDITAIGGADLSHRRARKSVRLSSRRARGCFRFDAAAYRNRGAHGPRHRPDDASGKASFPSALGAIMNRQRCRFSISRGFGRRLFRALRSSRSTLGASGRRRARCPRR